MKNQPVKPFIWEILKLIIPAFIGFLLAYITFSKQYDANEKGRLNENLNKLLDKDFEYPFLEDSSFIAWWDKHKESNCDSSLRYQAYCAYVFNFLQNTCEYFDYNKRKITDFVDAEDLISQHKGWWMMPEQTNARSYPEKFKEFVGQYLK
jgi:hypothetical protein